MKRKLVSGLIGACLLCVNISPIYGKTLFYDGVAHEYNLPSISLYVNNQKIETTVMDPVSINGRVLVPAREVFEPLGAAVQWDAVSKKVIIDYKDSTMILTANEQDVQIDNRIVQLDVPAKIINDKIMIPIRFVSETMGFGVSWIGSTYSVYINADGSIITDSNNNTSNNNTSNNNTSNNTGSNTNNSINGESSNLNIKDDESNIDKVPSYIPGTVTSQGYSGGSNVHYLDITARINDTANVNSVTVTEAQNKVVATINLSEALSDADISIANGKVIIDIKNSVNKLSSSSIPNTNTYIERIRTSQFTADTTRVVFDLKSGAIAKAYTTDSRKKLVVELQKQNIEEIAVTSKGNKDQVYFKGLFNNQISFNKEDNSLTFQINNSYLNQAVNLNNLWANYIDCIILTPEGNHVKGTIYLSTDVNHEVQTTTSGTILTLSEIKEVGYIYNGNGTIYLPKTSGVTQSRISFTDNYRERQIIVDLGWDYSHYFETGTIEINDSKITSIQVANSDTTKLIVTTPTVQAFNMYDTGDTIGITLVKPSEKYDKIVVIDPGHGGSDSGAVAHGLKEKAINLKHAMAVYNLLVQNTDIKVYMTRETDVYPTLQDRTVLANEVEADLFVSFHNNSASAGVTGAETLYYPSATDTRGKAVAKLIQDNIIKYCGVVNRGIKPRSDLYVLRTSNMPAVLIEGGFITNETEANIINSVAFINAFGQAVYEAIVESFNIIK